MQDPNWSTNDISDQSGKTAIVTGATSGIGKETARVLAGKGAKVILAVRNTVKGRSVADDIRKSLPQADIFVRRLDLASLSSVKAFADSCLQDEARLDILVNNAGVMFPPYTKTEDGFELQMGTNHLGHFALAGRLLPLLKATHESRIAVVSSLAHTRGKIDFEDMQWERRPFNTQQAYCDSKLANLYFTLELARRLKARGDNIIVAAAHPGWTKTELQRHSGVLQFLNHLFSQGPDMGALPTLRAACAPDVRPGDYFGPSRFSEMHGPAVKVSPAKRAQDHDIARKFWAVSEELTGVSY
ncbi:MAG: oxidoreductase [Rhizomicrobium sp.]